MLGGLLEVRPGDRLLRQKVKHIYHDNDDDGGDSGDDDCKNSFSTWMDFSEFKVNLLTPSLMLGDCFATNMAGEEGKHLC